ncbi:MAG: hypothetical protein R3290_09695 [Acidimicrobiia bacterium]|nr:hypothetical protein [Acidimicrobiia bacterium]
MRFTERSAANEFLRAQNRRLYDLGAREMRRLMESLTDEERAARNACCPAWSNQDVVAHHIHFTGADDVPDSIMMALRETTQAAYDATRAERDGWTAAGVEARRDRSLQELWDEWDSLRDQNPDAFFPTVDLTMHLFDIEESLGRTDKTRTELAFDALLGYVTWFLVDKVDTAGQALNLEPTDVDHTLAFFDDAPIVTGSSYDLLRCVGGRRTRAQADHLLDWGDTPTEARDLLSVYTWPADSGVPA